MDLREIVHEIRNKVLNDYPIENLKKDYSEFGKMYPKLLQMILQKKCDSYMLEKLLHCFSLRGSMTDEKNDEQFGTYAVKKYITKK
jgi:hypothetical protein